MAKKIIFNWHRNVLPCVNVNQHKQASSAPGLLNFWRKFGVHEKYPHRIPSSISWMVPSSRSKFTSDSRSSMSSFESELSSKVLNRTSPFCGERLPESVRRRARCVILSKIYLKYSWKKQTKGYLSQKMLSHFNCPSLKYKFTLSPNYRLQNGTIKFKIYKNNNKSSEFHEKLKQLWAHKRLNS